VITAPDQYLIDTALELARRSPCRSKRGVVLWDPANGAHRGGGFNGPPTGFSCPGPELCRRRAVQQETHIIQGTCGLRSIHAEMRAIDEARGYIARHHPPGPYDLLHVELAPDGGVVACDGPACAQCSKHIVECGFVARVWLYVANPLRDERMPDAFRPAWLSYDIAEFHRLSLIANGAAQ